MADRCNRFAGSKELLHDLQDAGIQTDVFRCAPAGNEQACIVLCLHRIEVRSQREVVPAEFGIGLLAEEIMNRRGNGFTGLLVRADSIHLVAQYAECLERHHGFVILGEIAAEQQYFFSHKNNLLYRICVGWLF